ncbi:MAG TPA: hypothetical protein VGS41_11105, partial [Chthonomonadales bacterium]|nr:hypothetical protein [Chthonomonadales bacterium]
SLSIPGVIGGLVRRIYNAPPPIQMRGFAPGIPPLWPLLAIAAGVCAVSLLAARARVNAVEVVRG